MIYTSEGLCVWDSLLSQRAVARTKKGPCARLRVGRSGAGTEKETERRDSREKAMKHLSKCIDFGWAAWLCFFFLCAVTTSVRAEAVERLAPEKLPLLERQRWALTMLDRLEQANRVILDPKYVVRQNKRFETLAQPYVLGTSPEETRKKVKAIRATVKKSERIAIEHLDRQFRNALNRKLSDKSNEPLQHRWLEAWKKTVETWQKSDDPTDRLDQLIVWLQSSRTTLEGKQYATITPIPSFTEKKPVKRATKVAATSPVPTPSSLVEASSAPSPSLPPRVVKRPVDPMATFSVNRGSKERDQERRGNRSERPALKINLSELAAQVSGNNLALRRLEAKLVAGGKWDAKQIDPFVVQLKRIAIRLADAKMVYQLLSSSQQKQIDRIADPAAAIKSLRSKIRTARVTELESRGPSASLTKEQRLELRSLDRMTEELDSIDDSSVQESKQLP